MTTGIITPFILTGYVIGITVSLLGVVGVIINAMLEAYYLYRKNWGLSLLPPWMWWYHFGTLWVARIGTFIASWTLILHCYIYMTNLKSIEWWFYIIALFVIEVMILMNALDTFEKGKELKDRDAELQYDRKVEHALYASVSPCITLLFMAILTVYGLIRLWQ